MIFDRPWDDTPNGPRLIGGKSKETGKVTFPLPRGADTDLFDPIFLKSTGKLWSYTIQRFPPKNPPYIGVNSPAEFRPYAVGYVELEDEVIVEARLATKDFDGLSIGQDMSLMILELERGDGQGHFKAFAFSPKTEQ